MRSVLIRLTNGDECLKSFTGTSGSTTLSILKMGVLSTTTYLLRMRNGRLQPVNMLDDDSTPIMIWRWDMWPVLIMIMVMYAGRLASVHQVSLL